MPISKEEFSQVLTFLNTIFFRSIFGRACSILQAANWNLYPEFSLTELTVESVITNEFVVRDNNKGTIIIKPIEGEGNIFFEYSSQCEYTKQGSKKLNKKSKTDKIKEKPDDNCSYNKQKSKTDKK